MQLAELKLQSELSRQNLLGALANLNQVTREAGRMSAWLTEHGEALSSRQERDEVGVLIMGLNAGYIAGETEHLAGELTALAAAMNTLNEQIGGMQ